MYLRFVLASACWLSLAGAASAETVLNRDSGSDPSSLDQHRTTTAQEGALLRDLYEGLVTEDGKGELIPGVAQSWDISSDGLTYTFRLRENAKWSNGDPVTAGDFEYSLRRIMDPKTGAGYASILYPIKNAREINTGKLPVDQLGVHSLDDHTLKITLASPPLISFPYWPIKRPCRSTGKRSRNTATSSPWQETWCRTVHTHW